MRLTGRLQLYRNVFELLVTLPPPMKVGWTDRQTLSLCFCAMRPYKNNEHANSNTVFTYCTPRQICFK